ncbi:hypothetical protein EBX93_08955 [bacterium]|nr:hypothetical protein [bacterium]
MGLERVGKDSGGAREIFEYVLCHGKITQSKANQMNVVTIAYQVAFMKTHSKDEFVAASF